MSRSHRATRRLAFLAPTLVLAAFANFAGAEEKPPTGVVNVQGNVATAPGNRIICYRRDNSGRLTELPGSPYATGGAGTFPSSHFGLRPAMSRV